MGRRHVFLKVSQEEARDISEFIKNAKSNWDRTRAQAVWFSSQRRTVQEISALLSVTERAIWNWLDAYRKEGLEGLKRKVYSQRETVVGPKQEERLVAITRQAPNTVGIEGHTWNCRLLSDWLDKTFHIRVTDEWVRQILLKHNLRFRRPKLKLTSPDPDYAQKKMLSSN